MYVDVYFDDLTKNDVSFPVTLYFSTIGLFTK